VEKASSVCHLCGNGGGQRDPVVISINQSIPKPETVGFAIHMAIIAR
jgi:hypothetical protein